ncbi:MAG: molybdopterin-dependent oxidoreductase [Chloroflexaceae bacterium]|nr:molybdopterin-dependent oxidoreductase [Chloroflexaceae bacterium]
MRKTSSSLWYGALAGGLLTAPLMSVLYLGQELADLPFMPFTLFDWFTRVLPGPLITFGLDTMISLFLALGISIADTGKLAEQTMAVLMFWLLGTLTGSLFFVGLRVAHRVRAVVLAGLVPGAFVGLPLVAIDVVIGQSSLPGWVRVLWLALVFLAWGVALGWCHYRLLPATAAATATIATPPAEAPEPRTVERIDRRTFLIKLGASSATITLIGAGAGSLLATRRSSEPAPDGQTRTDDDDGDTGGKSDRGTGTPETPPFPNADDLVQPVLGTRPEYTPIQDHYRVFIRTQTTRIDGESWRLPVTGLVERPLMLSLDDIRTNYEAMEQYVTIACISGRIPTDLIGTTLWTGVSVQDVLADAGVQDGAQHLFITSGDGFYETVPLDLIRQDRRIMFAYAWDRRPLPVDHGYPLRIWIPNRYGMKQPKWITGVEVVSDYRPGYWVERGWSREAVMHAWSFIDTVAVDSMMEDGGRRLVPIGGIAFAGDRGISSVEVRVNDGPWEQAQVREPLSETTWAIWRYEWPFQEGEHTFAVRCTDGNGDLQVTEPGDPRPDGSTGIHTVTRTF